MSVQTPECLAPGDARVPDVTCPLWQPTDAKAPRIGHGWLITAWDFDGTEYGRKATTSEWASIFNDTKFTTVRHP